MKGKNVKPKSSSVKAMLVLLASLFIVSAGSAAAAERCPMCYTTASGAGRDTVHALRSGTVMLAIPPVLLFGGMLAVALRWRDDPDEQDKAHSGERHS
jgi:hypothetical protein